MISGFLDINVSLWDVIVEEEKSTKGERV
jgi:hypothetical protein